MSPCLSLILYLLIASLPIPWLPVASPYNNPLAACCLLYTYPWLPVASPIPIPGCLLPPLYLSPGCLLPPYPLVRSVRVSEQMDGHGKTWDYKPQRENFKK